MNSDLINKISSIALPIVVISYNNCKYVENTMKQLHKVDPKLIESVIIMDNRSTDIDMIQYLDTNPHNVVILRNRENYGPRIYEKGNIELFNILPERFVITDPDLEYHLELPTNFIEILGEILDKYPTQKAGFAISIEDHDDFYKDDYLGGNTIYQWESQFWNSGIKEEFHSSYYNKSIDIYHAKIDTTFALYQKSRMITYGDHQWDGIRVGGFFTCRHLPFYINDPIMSIEDRYLHYSQSKFSLVSTMSRVILRYIEENYTHHQTEGKIIFTKK